MSRPSGFEPVQPTRTRKGPIAEALIHMVEAAGFEPARLAAEDFKSPASANSATPP